MKNQIALGGLMLVGTLGGFACGGGSNNDPPPSALRLLVTLHSPVSPRGQYDSVAVSGRYAYAAAGEIHIYDVKNGADASEIGVFTAQSVHGLAVRGSLLFYADVNGANVADISDPTTIKPLRVIPEFDENALRSITYAPTQTLVASASVTTLNEVVLFDLTHAENPELVGRFTASAPVLHLAVEGKLVYVSIQTGSLGTDGTVEIYDATNVAAPKKLSSVLGRTGLLFPVSKGIVYCGDSGGLPRDKPVLDARDPSNPVFPKVEVVNDSAGGWILATGFLHVGSYVFIAAGGGVGAYDIKDPFRPTVAPHYISAQLSGQFNVVATGMTFDDRFFYATNEDGLAILDRHGQ